MPLICEISALVTAFFWSISSLSFAAATRTTGSVQVNVTRLILATVLLSGLVLIARLDTQVSTLQMMYLGASSIIGFAFGDTFLFLSFKRIGARLTMLVMSLAPAVATLLAYILLGEELSTVGVLGIVVTILGISFVVLEPGSVNGGTTVLHATIGGLAYALLAAIGQGGGLVVAKLAFREGAVNGFVATEIRVTASLLVLLPAAVMSGKYRRPVRTFRKDPRAFLFTAIGAVFGPFLGVAGSLIAIQHTKVGIAATLMATTPILMLPLVHIVHKEQLTWRAFAGAFIAVGGIAILFVR